MNVLDTDVLSHLQKNDPVGALILSHLSTFPDQDFRITTVNAHEMLSGAINLIEKERRKRKIRPQDSNFYWSCANTW